MSTKLSSNLPVTESYLTYNNALYVKYSIGFAYDKCLKVIRSCKTRQQLDSAKAYIDLFVQQYTIDTAKSSRIFGTVVHNIHETYFNQLDIVDPKYYK
jgi:hypothetical protein